MSRVWHASHAFSPRVAARLVSGAARNRSGGRASRALPHTRHRPVRHFVRATPVSSHFSGHFPWKNSHRRQDGGDMPKLACWSLHSGTRPPTCCLPCRPGETKTSAVPTTCVVNLRALLPAAAVVTDTKTVLCLSFLNPSGISIAYIRAIAMHTRSASA